VLERHSLQTILAGCRKSSLRQPRAPCGARRKDTFHHPATAAHSPRHP
jgi:hypothetical protein